MHGGGAHAQPLGVHHRVRPFQIGRLTALVEVAQRLPLLHGDSARFHVLEAAGKRLQREPEENHQAVFLQVLHGRVLHGHRSARGDHRAARLQPAHARLLHVREALRAQFVHHPLQRPPGLSLKQQVRVHKIHRQGLGRQHAHRALAASGHADQNHIAHASVPLSAHHCTTVRQKTPHAHAARRKRPAPDFASFQAAGLCYNGSGAPISVS